MSYPHLFPAGFIEFKDPCSGPSLYRNQPSRESNAPRLNDFMNKYVEGGDYTDNDFIRMSANLKNTSKTWNNLPNSIKKEFLNLIINSNSSLADDIIQERMGKEKQMSASKRVENFGENVSSESAFDNGVQPKNSNKMNIFIIVIVSIVAIVIGFLIACSGSS